MPTINNKIPHYFSLVKFSHTVFALPFAIIGFFLAINTTTAILSWTLLLLVVLCMVFARSAAMAFNRYTDRSIDTMNERTNSREIPSGKLSPTAALTFAIVSALLFIVTTYFINTICFLLSPVALLTILGYSYTKRFTYLCHFVLGTGLALAPIGAYLAVTGQFDWLPLFFSFAVLCWVSGFDIIYALQDEDFDKSQQLNSIPAVIGKRKALSLSIILHIATSLFIVFAGYYADFGLWYWLGAGIFIGLLFYQHMLVKVDNLSKINLVFFTTNGIASVVFCVFFLLELYL